jgi:hypothetical protein
VNLRKDHYLILTCVKEEENAAIGEREFFLSERPLKNGVCVWRGGNFSLYSVLLFLFTCFFVCVNFVVATTTIVVAGIIYISVFIFIICNTKKERQLSAMDLLALASMKNAAKCDT